MSSHTEFFDLFSSGALPVRHEIRQSSVRFECWFDFDCRPFVRRRGCSAWLLPDGERLVETTTIPAAAAAAAAASRRVLYRGRYGRLGSALREDHGIIEMEPPSSMPSPQQASKPACLPASHLRQQGSRRLLAGRQTGSAPLRTAPRLTRANCPTDRPRLSDC